MKYRTIIFWGILCCCLFIFLQYRYAFFFFYIEQLQLFPMTGQYFMDTVSQPGGVAHYVAGFLLQFYGVPFAGPFITTGLLVGVGLFSQCIFRRIIPSAYSYVPALLPILILVSLHTDMNYRIQGTVAFLFMLVFFLLYMRLPHFRFRIVFGFLSLLLLFYLSGPIMTLFGVTILLWELMRRERGWYYSFGLLVEVGIIAFVALNEGWQGEYRMVVLPDFYYEPLLKTKLLYALWILFSGCLFLSWFMRNKNEKTGWKAWGMFIVQLFPLFFCLYWENSKSISFEHENMKQDYYLRAEQWDKIISIFAAEKSNVQTMSVLNLALACKGELGDKLFDYPQLGQECLFPKWNSALPSAIVMSDIWYHTGDIAQAQKYAFEGCVAATDGSSRLLQRLVRTNLIYGAYPVAEKYIRLLEQTLFYKDWANRQRQYLYNDVLLSRDSELGGKRSGLKLEKPYAEFFSEVKTLEQLAVNNPENRIAFRYLTSYLLLGKKLNIFNELHNKYYHTKVWPSLSVSEQEAIIALEQDNPSVWVHKGVSLKVEQHFSAFNQDMQEKHGFINFTEVMAAAYGDTYWFYLMFKK